MIWLSHDNIITSLGSDTEQNLAAIGKSLTGIRKHTDFKEITNAPISLIDRDIVNNELNVVFPDNDFTHFESLVVLSLHKALIQSNINTGNPRTLFILSTTKGNIELLERGKEPPPQYYLYATAEKIGRVFGFRNKPLVVCNACISGVLAILLANRYISSGKFDHVIVTGADVITEFVVAGFESFKSMSEQACRPFDESRDGLSLGEGAGTLILSNHDEKPGIGLFHGASANDANHISGPSRTGEGLYLAAHASLKDNLDIDFISAHGTATPYNDDMESQAIHRMGLNAVPVNSFKGYFGHTLGAAGIIETILTKHSMLRNRIYPTLGLQKIGVVKNINAVNTAIDRELHTSLKLASGFGGCNAALVLRKYE
jgi:3-oxoacyl-[acyl-carrier-protein] synthase-1